MLFGCRCPAACGYVLFYINTVIFLFVLLFNDPVNSFSIVLGRSQFTNTLGSLKCLAQGH